MLKKKKKKSTQFSCEKYDQRWEGMEGEWYLIELQAQLSSKASTWTSSPCY